MAKKKEMCSSENHEPGAGIVLMKLEELHSFEGHPFKVEMLRKANPDMEETAIPVELVTCSGSGLDQHISPAAAKYQVTRIAKANNMSEEKVGAIIEKCTDSRFLGVFGEKTVNVLKVNLMLDGIL